MITDELEGDEYAAYRVLTDHAREEDVKIVANSGKINPIVNELCQKIIEFVDSKNPNLIDTIKGGEENMGRTLMDIMRPEIDKEYSQREKEHDRINLFTYVIDGVMPVDYAAKHAGLTPEQFKKDLESYKESIANPQSL